MGINDRHNDADGKDPDFGAIFISNSETKCECFKKGLFGLPSTEIQFVEQIKTGMILFLFEYEKRQLHGVFRASSDGTVNIVPNAFAKVGKQYPAQVKFDLIWFCEPLPEKLFRDAIRENYYSANKFNFGLSENQVYKLLYLFRKRKLEPEAPGRPLSRTEDLKSERYPFGKVGRSVDHGMHIERVQNEQDVGCNISPITMHNCQAGWLQYNGHVQYNGLNASDIKQGGAPQFAVDTTSGYVSDYLGLKDESRFTAYENEDYMDICLRPNMIGRYSKSPSDKSRAHGEGRLSISDRLMSKSLPETDERIVFSNDVPGSHNSNVNPSGFYSKPILEHNSLLRNQFRPTSMIHPMQTHILNSTCPTQGDGNFKSASLLYDPDCPGLNFSQASSIGINDGSKPIMERISPSNNFRRDSLNSQPHFLNRELKDIKRWHSVGGEFQNSVLYGSNRDCMPLNRVQNSVQLAAESVVYEDFDIHSLKSSSAAILHPDVGKSSSLHDPFSSLFHNNHSWLGNNFHSTALQENPSHEVTLRKSNEAFAPDISLPNEYHYSDGDQLIHEHDIGCYSDSQNYTSGYPKSSVFSRLSFMKDIHKNKNRKIAMNEEYDFPTSVDEVMERVRQSQNKWMKKRKPKPKPNQTESLKEKPQISSSRMKGDFFEKALTDQIMDLTTATGGNTNRTAEVTCFLDFKRRSKVRKLSDENEIRSSNEREKNEDLMLGQQKRRKLIRPNFSKSIASDDKDIDLGASQNLQVPSSLGDYNVKDLRERCPALVQIEDNIKADTEVRNGTHSQDKKGSHAKGCACVGEISETHSEDKEGSHARGCVCIEEGEITADSALIVFNDKSECLGSNNEEAEVQHTSSRIQPEDKNSAHATGYVCGKGGEKPTSGALAAFSDGSKCENINQNIKSCHIKKGLCMMDGIKSVSLNIESSHSICQEHHVHKSICACREKPNDCCSSFTIEDKDGSEYLQNSGNEKALIETSHPVKECIHVIDSLKPVAASTDSLCSIWQEKHTGKKIIRTGRGSKEEMSKDGGPFLVGVKDAVDCLQNSKNENASIADSCFKEGLCMTDSKKSLSPCRESLHSICQKFQVDKAICVDGAIRTRERMSKDHRSSTTEAKGGSDSSENYEVKGESVSSQQCGNGNAPIATCEQNIAESDSQYRLNPHL